MNRLRLTIFSTILLSLFSFFILSSPSAESGLGEGRISLIQGHVLIQTKDGEEWEEASVNFPITEGDHILTEQDGRAEVHFRNGTYVRVGEESQVDILTLNFDQWKTFIHLNLLEGRVYVNYRPDAGKNSSFCLDLPHGVLAAYGPSRFRVGLIPSETKISVLEGSVEFKSNGRPYLLSQGKTFLLGAGDSIEENRRYGRDEWDRWNETRDGELEQRRYAQTDLPPELEPWGYEMEGHGRWVYSTEYRYVWVPTVVTGWAPFRHGYWTWRRGVYCWIPYEPWGWIPFHFGRWVHIHIHCWAWVPPFRHAIIWHPGAVGWYIVPRYISWVPLAPGEIYYGYRSYGPYSVNITRGNTHIPKNVFVNSQIKDAVVTVHKDSFFKRDPVKVAHVENPFLRPVQVSGPPTEKPVFLEGKRTLSRPSKEFIEKVHPERPSREERKENISPAGKILNDKEPKDFRKGSDGNAFGPFIPNKVEKKNPPSSRSHPWEKRTSTPFSRRPLQ